jgi:hypothetical protein
MLDSGFGLEADEVRSVSLMFRATSLPTFICYICFYVNYISLLFNILIKLLEVII